MKIILEHTQCFLSAHAKLLPPVPPGESIWNHQRSRRSRRPRRSTISQVNNTIKIFCSIICLLSALLLPLLSRWPFLWRITQRGDINDRLPRHFSYKMLSQSSTYYVSVLSLALTFANFPWLSLNLAVMFLSIFASNYISVMVVWSFVVRFLNPNFQVSWRIWRRSFVALTQN